MLLHNFGTPIGLVAESIATGWAVLQLTNSPFWLGVVAAIRGLTLLIISIVGGAVADRLDLRGLLIRIQVCNSLLFIGIAGLVLSGRVEIWQLLAVQVAAGFLQAMSRPANQVTVYVTVGLGRTEAAAGDPNSLTFEYEADGPELRRTTTVRSGPCGPQTWRCRPLGESVSLRRGPTPSIATTAKLRPRAVRKVCRRAAVATMILDLTPNSELTRLRILLAWRTMTQRGDSSLTATSADLGGLRRTARWLDWRSLRSEWTAEDG